jgi:hypothetical protein
LDHKEEETFENEKERETQNQRSDIEWVSFFSFSVSSSLFVMQFPKDQIFY